MCMWKLLLSWKDLDTGTCTGAHAQAHTHTHTYIETDIVDVAGILFKWFRIYFRLFSFMYYQWPEYQSSSLILTLYRRIYNNNSNNKILEIPPALVTLLNYAHTPTMAAAAAAIIRIHIVKSVAHINQFNTYIKVMFNILCVRDQQKTLQKRNSRIWIKRSEAIAVKWNERTANHHHYILCAYKYLFYKITV